MATRRREHGREGAKRKKLTGKSRESLITKETTERHRRQTEAWMSIVKIVEGDSNLGSITIASGEAACPAFEMAVPHG